MSSIPNYQPATFNVPTLTSVAIGPATALLFKKWGEGLIGNRGALVAGLLCTAVSLHYLRNEHQKEPNMGRRVVHSLGVVGCTAALNAFALYYFG